MKSFLKRKPSEPIRNNNPGLALAWRVSNSLKIFLNGGSLSPTEILHKSTDDEMSHKIKTSEIALV